MIQYIGDRMVGLIKMVPPDNQMVVALVLVVWVSALASSFIDNIPFTTATVRGLTFSLYFCLNYDLTSLLLTCCLYMLVCTYY